MNDHEIIAERQVMFGYANGETRLGTIRIFKPTPHEKGDWACRVAIEGIAELNRPIFGVDSWQALMLAIKLLKQSLESYVSSGVELRWADTPESITVKELFGT